MLLKQIFEAITPDNIKDIPLIATAMDIFIEQLEENSELSICIRALTDYDQFLEKYEAETFKEQAIKLREGILKTYLSALYKVITTSQTNKLIQDKIELNQFSVVPLKYDVTKILNNEYLLSNKSFKQTVGTQTGFDFAYHLAKYLEHGDLTAESLSIEEIYPFHFLTEGAVSREVYEQIIKPIAHPLGFTSRYVQLLDEAVSEFFSLITEYNFSMIEVRCLEGYIDVFTSDNDDTYIKADFLTRINGLTGNLYTEDEYNEYVTVYTNKFVSDFTQTILENVATEVIYFSDGTIIKNVTSPITVYYRYLENEEAGDDTYIKYYNDLGQCSLYTEYESTFTAQYQDDITEFLQAFDISQDELYDLADQSNIIDDFIVNIIGYGYYMSLSTDEYLTMEFDDDSYNYSDPSVTDPDGLVTGYYLSVLDDEELFSRITEILATMGVQEIAGFVELLLDEYPDEFSEYTFENYDRADLNTMLDILGSNYYPAILELLQ